MQNSRKSTLNFQREQGWEDRVNEKEAFDWTGEKHYLPNTPKMTITGK